MSSMTLLQMLKQTYLPRWARAAIVGARLILGGGAGLALGRFLEMLVDIAVPLHWSVRPWGRVRRCFVVAPLARMICLTISATPRNFRPEFTGLL